MAGEASLSEEKAQKAMIDAARLADELRTEQEQAQHAEKSRLALEYQVKDMHNNLERRKEGHGLSQPEDQGFGEPTGR